MTLGEFKAIIKDMPDNVVVKVLNLDLSNDIRLHIKHPETFPSELHFQTSYNETW